MSTQKNAGQTTHRSNTWERKLAGRMLGVVLLCVGIMMMALGARYGELGIGFWHSQGCWLMFGLFIAAGGAACAARNKA